MSRARAGLHIFVLLFALSTIPGLLIAYDPSLSIPAFLFIWVGAALYLGLVIFARSERLLRAAALTYLGTSASLALFVVSQYRYLGYDESDLVVPFGILISVLPDLGGPRIHPNAAASFMEAAIPVGVALAVTGRRTASKVALWVACATILYAIVLTASRGALLALTVTGFLALLLFLIFPRLRKGVPRRSRVAVVALLALAILLAAWIAANSSLSSASLQPPQAINSFLSSTLERATDRFTLYNNSLYLVRDYLFTGAGLGNTFGMVYSRYGLLLYVPFLYYPHNLFLSAWFNQGLVGLIALAGIGLSLLLLISRMTRAAKPSPLFLGAWLGAIVVLLHGVTDAPQYDPHSYWVMPVFFAILGLITASAARTPVTARPTLNPTGHGLGPTLNPTRHRLINSTRPTLHGLNPIMNPNRHVLDPIRNFIRTALNLALDPARHALNPALSHTRHALNPALGPTRHALNPALGPTRHALNPALSHTRHAPNPIHPPSVTTVAGLTVIFILALSIVMIFGKTLEAAWHTNLGALAETQSDLSPHLSDENRANFCQLAESHYRAALAIDPAWPSAQRRLGNLLVRLDRFDEAVPLLELAYRAEPANPAALKGLGLAYTWTGRTEEAAHLLRQVAFPSDMRAELRYWAFYRSARGQSLLSTYALESLSRAYPRRP